MSGPVQTPAPSWRAARGLVFVRLKPIRGHPWIEQQVAAGKLAPGAQMPGQVLAIMRTDERAPPHMADAWKPAGGKTVYDFGGRWLERGDRKLVWEWANG